MQFIIMLVYMWYVLPVVGSAGDMFF